MKPGCLVTKMVTDEINDLPWSLFRLKSPKQRFSTENWQLKTIKADAFGDLLQVKFDSSLFGVWQIRLGLEKHD